MSNHKPVKLHPNMKPAKTVEELRNNLITIMTDFYNGKLTLFEARVLVRLAYAILKTLAIESAQAKRLNFIIPIKFLGTK